MFEKMRISLLPGQVLSRTFDQAVRRRCQVNGEKSVTPRVVDPDVFDSDVCTLQNMTEAELATFDAEVCHVRMESRDEKSGGVYTYGSRISGFGQDVFGFAYDLYSGKWCMTNEYGLHAYCDSTLRDMCGEDEYEIVSAFIFQLPSLRTPIMTPYGYAYNSPKLMRKGFEELWAWKRFIPIADTQTGPNMYRWGHLFTPDFAEKVSGQQ